MGEVTISTAEYRKLLELQARIDIFTKVVKMYSYGFSREECADYLDFEPEEQETD